jgi:hypothetical protein
MNTQTVYGTKSRPMLWEDICFAHLCIKYRRYGVSAISTYYGARYLNGFSASNSLRIMRMQLKELGPDYPGGLECVKFRGPERIKVILNN